MRTRRSTPSTLLLPLLAALGTTAAHAAPERFDIVGLRLGMSESQARAALEAHDAALQTQDVRLRYTFRDGVKQHQTSDFLSEIKAAKVGPLGTASDSITLTFSTPPKPQRLIGVARVASIGQQRPTHEQLVQATIDKYGPPAYASPRTRTNPTTLLLWAEPGRPQCWRTSAKQTAGYTEPNSNLDILRQLAHRQKQGIAPANLSQCGATLRFSTLGDPPGTFSASMNDMGYWLETLEATAAWVGEQEAAARKARVGQGQAPKL